MKMGQGGSSAWPPARLKDRCIFRAFICLLLIRLLIIVEAAKPVGNFLISVENKLPIMQFLEQIFEIKLF